jgi:hypothetical protein
MTLPTEILHETCNAALDNDRLNEELPLMRKENRRLTQFIKDGAAFIQQARGEWSDHVVITTLAHDFRGLANDEPCFLPRVTGYWKRKEEGKQ